MRSGCSHGVQSAVVWAVSRDVRLFDGRWSVASALAKKPFLTLGTFLGCHAVVADARLVANVHDADDGLKRGFAIGANDDRLVGRIVRDGDTQQSLQFVQSW